MKILYAASEGAPFIKTGGLGDVAGALPPQLAKIDGNEVVVFLPYYSSIKNNSEFKIEYVTSFWVSLAWRGQYCGLFKYQEKKRKAPISYMEAMEKRIELKQNIAMVMSIVSLIFAVIVLVFG